MEGNAAVSIQEVRSQSSKSAIPVMIGNKRLFNQTITPLQDKMIRSIWRIVRDPQAAEDTLQDVLTIIWKRLDRILNHPNPQALILKICINPACDTLRKRVRIHEREFQNYPQCRESGTGSLIQSEIEAKGLERQILKAIGRLPRKQSAAVLMRIIQDHNYETIAQVLGCSETTARIHVSKGRAKLSKWLAPLNPAANQEHKE